MTDPYVILGVSPSSTDDEIREAYRKMSLKYHPDRHSQSPLSDLAEEKMKEINAAFDKIMDMRRGGGEQRYSYSSSQNYSGENSAFSEIRSQIKQGNLTAAENLLEQPTTQRNAEWSFLKGSVCYARGWLNEAFENFSNAVRLDPQNAEYNAALNSMINARQGNMNGNPNPYRGRDTVCGCSACDLCQGLVCADCCCECFGGDIISCC